ncbi:hypothetical protein LCGC14_1858690 [marine sediment metagenome]|uniref:Uncharacterized protein n=1 Tax=marine sediment metagenome TaxID=412755 RepID=A0A0F9J782_9ZZZZ
MSDEQKDEQAVNEQGIQPTHTNGNGNAARSKRIDTDIEKVSADPNFLAQYMEKDESLEALKEHRTVPRFKIIQPTTEEELKNTFGVGSAIVRPGDTLVCKNSANTNMEAYESFDFVPLFFFVEWAKWRDLKGTGDMVLERSFDPTSDVAVRSKNADTRKELYPGHENLQDNEKCYFQYVEHLRFLGTIYGEHPLTGTPVTLSFERGEWGQGKNFISAVSLRRQQVVIDKESGETVSKQVPLWAQVWRMKTVYHSPDALRKWYGFAFESAPESKIKESEAQVMYGLHKEFKELFDASRLIVQDDEQMSPDDAAVKETGDF